MGVEEGGNCVRVALKHKVHSPSLGNKTVTEIKRLAVLCSFSFFPSLIVVRGLLSLFFDRVLRRSHRSSGFFFAG